jgi:uncharacterized protein YceK
MIRLAPLIACVLLMTACGSPEGAGSKEPTDAIQALVDRLSADPTGGWANSLHPKLDLPPSATVEEVIDRMFQVVSLGQGRVTEFRILELRGVVIGSKPGERYNVARIHTNLGQKIVLFRRSHEDWWTRVYDVEPTP